MSRRNVRDRWTVEVLQSDRIGDGCRVLLLVMARGMTAGGVVSVRRDQLAETLGRHPQRVAERIGEAKRAGLLDQTGGGHRGHAAEYRATIRPAESVRDIGTQSPESVRDIGTRGAVRNPRSAASESERVPIEKDCVSVSEHLAVDEGRERRDDHDGSRAEPEHNDKDGSNEEHAGTRLPVDAAVDLGWIPRQLPPRGEERACRETHCALVLDWHATRLPSRADVYGAGSSVTPAREAAA